MTASRLNTFKVLDDRWIPWARWKEEWERADNTPACEGLLHSGFHTNVASAEEASERFCFYLQLAAAQWTSRPIVNNHSFLQRKAIKILADLDAPFNADMFEKELLGMTPETATQVFKFFRPNDGTEGEGLASFETPKARDNFELRDHTAKKLNKKLLQWCQWVWRKEYAYEGPYGSRGHWSRNAQTIALLEQKRFDVLDILHAYGNGKLEALLDVVSTLDDSDPKDLKCIYRVQWELFNPECIQRLYELASRKSGLTGPHTSGEAAEAALVAGSSAAKVLTLVQTAQKKRGQK